MPKANSGGVVYYAVRKGRVPGIYTDWSNEAEPQIKGFPGAVQKKFYNYDEAFQFINGKQLPQASTSASTSTSNNNGNSRSRPYPSSSTRFNKEADVEDESGWDVVYTDGSCTHNGGTGAKAGIGIWWGNDDPRNISERCPGDQTNNRAELIAIIRALETTPPLDRPLLIKTDSSYSIQCIRDWLPRWRQNHYRTADNKPVKNISLILYLSHLLSERGGGKVRLQHIKGHAGHEGNEGADRLAMRGTWMDEVPERDWKFDDGVGEGGEGMGSPLSSPVKTSDDRRVPVGQMVSPPSPSPRPNLNNTGGGSTSRNGDGHPFTNQSLTTTLSRPPLTSVRPPTTTTMAITRPRPPPPPPARVIAPAAASTSKPPPVTHQAAGYVDAIGEFDDLEDLLLSKEEMERLVNE